MNAWVGSNCFSVQREAAAPAKWEETTVRLFIYSYLMLQLEPRVSGMQTVGWATTYTLGGCSPYFFNSLTVSCLSIINSIPLSHSPTSPTKTLLNRVSESNFLMKSQSIQVSQTARFSTTSVTWSCVQWSVLPEVKSSFIAARASHRPD